jgi:serine/threonine protein phosphatase PrpC
MGICTSKSQAKTVTNTHIAVLPSSPNPPLSPPKEEQKTPIQALRKKYTRPKQKPSQIPSDSQEETEQDVLPLFGHKLHLEGSPSTQAQSGFEDKKVNIVTENFSLDLLRKTGIGYACKKGLKPESPNQDDFCIVLDEDTILLGVFDGHGPCGHYVSAFVHSDMAKLILDSGDLHTAPFAALRSAFISTNERLKAYCKESKGDCDCSISGTTAAVALIQGRKAYIAHVGDSRIIMGKKTESGFEAIQLTVDHKPTLPEEQKRIEASGGEVKKLPFDIPYRVFVYGTEDPGLSMSRSIGDTVSQSIGVTCEPELREVELEEYQGSFLLMCSDGVWEFIKNEEAVDLVSKFSRTTASQGAEKLAQLAWMRWLHNEEEVVDDITVIVSFVPKM